MIYTAVQYLWRKKANSIIRLTVITGERFNNMQGPSACLENMCIGTSWERKLKPYNCFWYEVLRAEKNYGLVVGKIWISWALRGAVSVWTHQTQEEEVDDLASYTNIKWTRTYQNSNVVSLSLTRVLHNYICYPCRRGQWQLLFVIHLWITTDDRLSNIMK